PTSEVYVQVGEELVRRARWEEAYVVLSRGTNTRRTPARALAALARAALESGHLPQALKAVSRVRQRVPELPASLARVEILALERAGRYDDARKRADARLRDDPDDVVAEAALERLRAPPPDVGKRARDPYFTVARAERYVEVGRSDRAVRAYRRILSNNRSDTAVESRLGQLLNGPHAPVDDDLSEELMDPGLVPPDLRPPKPRLRNLRRPTPVTPPRTAMAEAPEAEEIGDFQGLVEITIEGGFDDLDDLEAPSPRLPPRRRQ
ncbi:MAG: tetratricopeptide (TPR) repeat protein, partial [Myxococcota bacterium]